MKIKELIEELKKFDSEAEVIIRAEINYGEDFDVIEYDFEIFHEDETVCFLDIKS